MPAFADAIFRQRVWYPAVGAARLCGKRPPQRDGECRPGECGREACDDPAHRIRRFAPRAMRHTAASWLVRDGVPLYDVQALLGHEDYATTQRYANYRELHQMGALPQVAWRVGEGDGPTTSGGHAALRAFLAWRAR